MEWSMTNEKEGELETAIKNLQEATTIHHQASQELEIARRRETDAMNRLNSAQRKFDELTTALKMKAPRGSDWHGARSQKPGGTA